MSKRRILFLDRDGTLIVEPEDKQIDSLEKLQLVDGVIPALLSLKQAGYEFVIVSNQDGLGTASNPVEQKIHSGEISEKSLRTHVGQRSPEGTVLREDGGGRGFRADDACQSKIQDLRVPVGVHHDIGGLDVQMNHATLVGVVDCLADTVKEVKALATCGISLAKKHVQRLTLYKFHDQKVFPSGIARLSGRGISPQ